MKFPVILLAGLVAASSFSQVGQRARSISSAKRERPFRIAQQLPASVRLAVGAIGKLKYSGTRIVEGKLGANRVRHTEYVVTDGPHSRIEFPQDSPQYGQIIVESAIERQHYLPGRNELQILPPRREEAAFRINQLSNLKLKFSESSGGNVAGIATELVTIANRQGVVLQKLWIDPRTGMILKRELYDRLGTLEASFEFTEVNLRPIIHPSDFVIHPPKGVRIITPETTLAVLIKRGAFLDVRIPAGTPYRLQSARIQNILQQQVLVQQYAGAGHRLTLYQLKAPVDAARLDKLEGPNLQICTWQSGGTSFVLVGDLSDAELKDLGRRLGA